MLLVPELGQKGDLKVSPLKGTRPWGPEAVLPTKLQSEAGWSEAACLGPLASESSDSAVSAPSRPPQGASACVGISLCICAFFF